MREVYLGEGVATRLFHESDVNAQFMFDSIQLGLQTGLTPEQIADRRSEIESRRREQLGQPEVEDVDF